MNRVIISIYSNFANTGGAQDVTIMLASHFAQDDRKPIVLTRTPLDKIADKYVNVAEFKALNHSIVKHIVRTYDNPVFISHDRKSTVRMMLYRALGLDFRLIHVAHNTFKTLKHITVFPREVIAISNGVYDNLQNYFKLDKSCISIIPNGIVDKGWRSPRNTDDVRILLAGRICPVKRQVELARHLKGRLSTDVSLDFAGCGEDEAALKAEIDGASNMRYIGQINVEERIENYDYVMLFSEKEGLPLILIEACMYGKPMLTNDVSGMEDVNIDGKTGYVCQDYDALIARMSSLPRSNSDEYMYMAINARRQYENLFTLERMLEGYERLINNSGA